jgi:methylenetetrahydrofolate dehydrogenase (NADP+)/methenyltetrahydrofolate cyclohydrolase
MIIDGRAIASDILARVRNELTSASNHRGETSMIADGSELVVRAVVVQPTGATESYLRVKSARAEDAGMRMEIVQLPDTATTEEVRAAVLAPGADSVIVQLPLPASIDTRVVLDAIPLDKDADVLSQKSYEHFESGALDALLPPVVGAIKEVLARTNTTLVGKRVVVVGRGRLVGQPASVWLAAQGADVHVITRESENLSELASADIIVSGAGVPHLITPDLVKEGVVLIDAGTSESNGAIAGDAHPDCASVASVFTPVPGGMGPIAVACLFQNVSTLVLRMHQL